MKFIKGHLLLGVVCITGACVLILEVSALRILSPYFGNTLYSASSVISVVLAALSIGYYGGGTLADKRPSEQLFFGIIAVSGISVLLLQVLTVVLLPRLGSTLPITSGPLVAAASLFFTPSVLLGALSPFVVALEHKHKKKQGVGSIAGAVFFWSTVGSIAGSLLTGFVLIPSLGLTKIISSVGIILTAMGLFGMVVHRTPKRIVALMLMGIVVVVISIHFFVRNPFRVKVVYSADGEYERILIYEDTYAGKPARFLMQDRSYSAAFYHNSDELVFDYTKYFELYKLYFPDIAHALVIGGGGYSIPKALIAADNDVIVDVAEIEHSLYELAKEYFNVPDDPRLVNHVIDGRRFLHDSDTHYDVIFADAYQTVYSIPSHLTTVEFYRLVSQKLSKDGVFIGNFIGSTSRKSPSLLLSELATMRKVFTSVYMIAVTKPASLGAQNIILIATNSTKPLTLEHMPEGALFSSLKTHMVPVTRYDQDTYPVLTDDYAPVDYLVSPLLQQINVRSEYVMSGDEMMGIITSLQKRGPSYIGATEKNEVTQFIASELSIVADEVFRQEWQHNGQTLTNIIARFNIDAPRRILLATHYDTKKYAHNDQLYPEQPVPGANDGYSGVALLLELSRSLAVIGHELPVGVDIVLFDGEEGDPTIAGDYSSWYPLGSTYFVDHLKDYYTDNPEAVVVLDMICDRDLLISREAHSEQGASALNDSIWRIGEDMSPNIFVNTVGQAISDDHSPFLEKGIPAVLLIDFEYPYFHTSQDTVDKCSVRSMGSVGAVVWEWLTNYN